AKNLHGLVRDQLAAALLPLPHRATYAEIVAARLLRPEPRHFLCRRKRLRALRTTDRFGGFKSRRDLVELLRRKPIARFVLELVREREIAPRVVNMIEVRDRAIALGHFAQRIAAGEAVRADLARGEQLPLDVEQPKSDRAKTDPGARFV